MLKNLLFFFALSSQLFAQTCTYDEAGRKVREEDFGRIVEYHYDSTDRLTTIHKLNGEASLFIHYKYDDAGNITEESKSDASTIPLEYVAYSYDEWGNCITITRIVGESEAKEHFVYDTEGRLIEKRDALGAITTWVYTANQSREIDPKQRSITTSYGEKGNLVKKEWQNKEGALLLSETLTYNSASQIVQSEVTLQGERKLISQVSYNSQGLIESITKGERCWSYTYTPSKLVETIRQPNGIVLTYVYDASDHVQETRSSDGTIFHTFKYNERGDLIEATDQIAKQTTKREVDPFGNVLREELGNGLVVGRTVDHFDRTLQLCLPDHSRIHYNFDPVYLRSVTRCNAEGEPLYTHTYDSYDLSGNLLTENIIYDRGQIDHLIDLKGRTTAFLSLHLSQTCSFDETDLLIETTMNDDIYRYTFDDLSHLTSESLLSSVRSYRFDALGRLMTPSGSYDNNGNLATKKKGQETFLLTYDALNRLTEAVSEKQKIVFAYDPLGRKLSKRLYKRTSKAFEEISKEDYFYDDEQEIGSMAEGRLKELLVLGLNAPVALELGGSVLAPIVSLQGDLVILVNPESEEAERTYDYTALGEALRLSPEEKPFNPWRFGCLRLHPELGLIDQSFHHYDPVLGRWIEGETPDS
jgi:YD repeat-containing protein